MDNPQDEIKVVTLAFLTSEVEAKLLSDALNLEGIHSEVAGILTGSFRAEAPGRVKVLVQEKDLARAKELLDDYTHSKENIDWSKVDITGGEDAVDDGDENHSAGDDNSPTS
ncbi:MAG: putative signal transducing protein [Phycisphaerales bacterium JB063]